MKVKTTWVSEGDITRKWYIVDVADQVLGRAATKIATLLMGKNKPSFIPNMDMGDYVIVINSKKIKVTGNKKTSKIYQTYSGFPGGQTNVPFDKMLERKPNYIIRHAVKSMLPKNKIGKRQITRLYIYETDQHDKAPQKPEQVNI